MEKTCVDCGFRLPIDEFYRELKMADGFRNDCKSCMRAKMRARYHRYPERERERSRNYRDANIEKSRERVRVYRESHRKEAKEKSRQWRERQKELSTQ